MGKWIYLIFLLVTNVNGQMPSEALLIVNGHSLEGMKIAHTYAKGRHFPSERILILHPPLEFFRQENGAPRWTVSLNEAKIHLLEPVLQKMEELNDPSPTALILSPEWPTRVSLPNSPEISITGYLGCGGIVPEGNLIKEGKAISPWFSPPPDTPQNSARLLRYPQTGALRNPFFPSAMLGVYYVPLTTEKIENYLARSLKGDFRQPEGSIVFEINEDIRTKTRLHQYNLSAERLNAKGIPVAFLSAADPLPKKVIGVMAGAANMNIGRYKKSLQAGVFTDHLTSHSATFDLTHQTKLTEWLDAGAGASAGTVTEPYSIWTKFPEAALFERYLRGNTLLEALMQSIASPYQVLIVGDPLCRPWAKELKQLELQTEWDDFSLKVEVTGVPQGSRTQNDLFLDGKQIAGNGPVWEIPLNAEGTGPEVELIVHCRYLWAPPELGSLQKTIATPFAEDISLKGSVKADHVSLKLKSLNDLMMVEIYRGTTMIHTSTVSGNTPEIALSLIESGTGPVRLRVKAITSAGQIRWSNYLDLHPEAPR